MAPECRPVGLCGSGRARDSASGTQRDEGLFLPYATWERWAVQRTPRFIANSHAGARFVIEKLKVEARKVHVVQNGIEQAAP